MEHNLKVVQDVLNAREKQDRAVGLKNHEPLQWLALISKDLGLANESALNTLDGEVSTYSADILKYREQLVETAATAMAAIASLDLQYKI